jgi:hypothetical protein
MIKKTYLTLSFAFLIFSPLFFSPKSVKAQCVPGSNQYCCDNINNVCAENCNSGYIDQCTWNSGNCVWPLTATNCVMPTPTPFPPCGSGLNCTTATVTACMGSGGNVQSCTAPDGSTGNCCAPSLPSCLYPEGCYDCSWIIGSASTPPHCSATNASCASGYEPDYTVCSTYTAGNDSVGCNAQHGLRCVNTGSGTVNPSEVKIYCKGDDPTELTGDSGSKKIATAIGCIPIGGIVPFLTFLYPWALGMGGGIALLLIGYAGFLITTAAGNPQKLQSGKELLWAAIGGLLLIAFSGFILRVIGGDILQIFQ